MPLRKALVLGADGLPQQLQSGDSAGSNAFFTGSATLPAVSAILPSSLTFSVTPKITGDALAAGEAITITPAVALPGGLNLAYAIVTATNTVQVGLSSTVTLAIGAAPLVWLVTAHR